jgi:hypothetical protein
MSDTADKVTDVQKIMAALAAPFPAADLKCRPGSISNGKAMVLWYVDARTVAERLDEVLGVAGWESRFTALPDGCMMCELRLNIAGEWVTKTDVGSPSEQKDAGDRRKAAVSDGLKRAGVLAGIGRYLYRIQSTWAEFDGRRFLNPPTLPPGSYADPGDGRTISDGQRETLTQLLVKKGRTPGAALKWAGNHSDDLGDLTQPQYRSLIERLEKMPDTK